MIRWTGLAPWEIEFPFPGSLTSTFLRQVQLAPKRGEYVRVLTDACAQGYLVHKKHPSLGPPYGPRYRPTVGS